MKLISLSEKETHTILHTPHLIVNRPRLIEFIRSKRTDTNTLGSK